MLAAEINEWNTLPFIANHPVWRMAFEWIKNKSAHAMEGQHQDFPDTRMFARVMEYGLKPREEARYENHRFTVDLQYTISGAEGIEYTPSRLLVPKDEYIENKDFQFFETPKVSYGCVDNHEGHFCVLWPSDGHMPQLQVGNFRLVRKVVIKIPLDLVRH